MGTILVEGLGSVEIEGDAPTPEESKAIASSLTQKANPTQQPIVPKGQVVPEGATPKPQAQRQHLVPDETRQDIREFVGGQPQPQQFALEAAPGVVGSLVGGAAGTAAGPPGVVLGATVGGLLGEYLAQETGVAPEADVNLSIAAGGPAAGVAAGSLLQLSRKAVGAGVSKLPAVSSAQARLTERKAVEEFESLGGRIISDQRGLLARPSGDLYAAARSAGAVVNVNQLPNTLAALTVLKTEASKVAAFPETQQALRVIESTLETLTQGGAVDFDTLIRVRQLVGAAVSRFETYGGVKLGSAKKVFGAMADDIDTIAQGSSPARRPAKIAQAAAERAKLEFSVRDFEAAVAKFTKDVPGENSSTLNVAGLQKWLRDVTNPKHANYDKNFTVAMDSYLPDVKSRLSELAKLTDAGGPGGPGSIVVRGQTAKMGRMVIGGMLGFGTAGPVGGGVGALIGANVPEMISASLMSPKGAAALAKITQMGRGEIPAERWAVLGQIIAQAAKIKPPTMPEDEGVVRK